MSLVCPKGHASDDADYCSECGLRMTPPATVARACEAAVAEACEAAVSACPACTTPRTPGARYCEVCRFDFATSAPSLPPVGGIEPPATAPAPVAPPAQSSVSAPAEPFPGRNLWAVVAPDRALMAGGDPGLAFPEAEPSRSFPLDLDENLVGRRNGRAGVHPEIAVNDPSVSARHLKICRRGDGTLYLVDVNSSNGTRLNDRQVEPGVETALRPGDSLVIGAWTRIVIEAR